MALDERKQRVLQAIIDDYIATAEPIGSRTIARKYNLGVSPATIRNEMADLEIMGYLEQPHTSAGRIPSAKGYRFYVDELMSPRPLTDHEIALIKNWYQAKVRHIEGVFQETVKILARMTRNVSLILAPQMTQSAFKYIQFLPFDAQHMLVLIVTDAGFVENKIMDIPQGIELRELQHIADIFNRRLQGLTFDQIKLSVLKEIQRDAMGGSALFEAILELLEKSLTLEKAERVYTGGTTQLLNQPEFQDVNKVKMILNILEEEQLLTDLITQDTSDEVQIYIGSENKFSGIQDCSIVTATYQLDGRTIGRVAVLGPTRMEYPKVVAILEFMRHNLTQLIREFSW